jgi:hypothetical protein
MGGNVACIGQLHSNHDGLPNSGLWLQMRCLPVCPPAFYAEIEMHSIPAIAYASRPGCCVVTPLWDDSVPRYTPDLVRRLCRLSLIPSFGRVCVCGWEIGLRCNAISLLFSLRVFPSFYSAFSFAATDIHRPPFRRTHKLVP